MPDIVGFYLSRFIVTPANTLKMIAPFKLDDFSMPAHYDSGIVFYAPDEIARHGLGKATRADQDVHPLDGARQKYGRLACGITATHHNHFFATAQLGFDKSRGVVHTHTYEL